MRLLAPLLVLAAALAAVLMNPSQSILFGLDRQRFVSAAIGVAVLLWLLLSYLRSARPSDIARMAGAAATWALLLIALTGVYAYRFEVSDVAGRLAGELFPSEPEVGRGGEGHRQPAGRRRIRHRRQGEWRPRDLPVRHRRFGRGSHGRRRAPGGRQYSGSRIRRSRHHRQRLGACGRGSPRSDRGRADRRAKRRGARGAAGRSGGKPARQ